MKTPLPCASAKQPELGWNHAVRVMEYRQVGAIKWTNIGRGEEVWRAAESNKLN